MSATKIVKAEGRAAAPRYWSSDGERFDYDCLDDVIDQMDDPKVGDIVYFGDGVRPEPAQLCNADDVLDTMECRAYDVGGESAEDYPDDPGAEAKAELNATLSAWISKHCEPDFWRVVNVQEYALTADDLATVKA